MAARDGHDRLLRLQRNVVVEFWRALGLLVLSPATRNRDRDLHRWRCGHRQTRGNVMDTVTCCECGRVATKGEPLIETMDGDTYCQKCALSQFRTPSEKQAARDLDRKKKAEAAFRGMATERKVIRSLAACRQDIGLSLVKVPTPPHYQAKSIADFVGYSYGGGFVAMEVKSTVANRWSIAVMPDHQVAYLDDVARCAERHELAGGGAFVLLDLRTPGRWYLVPWRALRANRIAHPDDAWLVPYEADPLRFWTWIRGGKQPW